MLYNQEDIQLCENNTKKKLTWLIIVVSILLAAVIISFIMRQKNITIASTIFLGFFLTAYIGLVYMPAIIYKKRVLEIINGRKREVKGFIKNMYDEILARDGMDCRQIIVKVGEDKAGDEDVVLYIDAKKTLVDIKLGDPVKFACFDRFIYSYQKPDSLIIPIIK